MRNHSVPTDHEHAFEKIFAGLGKALEHYGLHNICVQESGFATVGQGRMWGDSAVRNDMTNSITMAVGHEERRIKQAVYQQEAQPWYASAWHLTGSGGRSWEWDFDSRPRGSGPLSNCLETYLEDLAAFPRADHLVPLWMRPTLAAAGAWDPATDRLTLDGKGRPTGAPAVMAEPEFWYLLPIRDSPTGPRRAFGHLPPGIDEVDLDLPLTGPPG